MLRAWDKNEPSILMAQTISHNIKYRRGKEKASKWTYIMSRKKHMLEVNNLEIRATVTCRNVTLYFFKTTSP